MKWLNYHHLIYFREIATQGSISKASEKLLIGQPALSAQLKQIEQYLGHDLFERRNRRLHLTEAGQVALKYANEISRLGQEFLQVMNDQSFTTKTHINLGALDSVPKAVIWSVVKKARDYGNCFVSITEAGGEELYKDLKLHNIDVVISNYQGELGTEKGMITKSFLKAPVAIYGHEKFRPLQENFPQSLSGHPFVLPTAHSKLRHDIEMYFESRDIHYELVAETQDTALQKILAQEGEGLIALTTFAADQLAESDDMIKLGELDGLEENYWLIATKRMIDNPVASHLLRASGTEVPDDASPSGSIE